MCLARGCDTETDGLLCPDCERAALKGKEVGLSRHKAQRTPDEAGTSHGADRADAPPDETDAGPLHLVLPLPPNRANAYWHWRTEGRKRSAYKQSCDNLALIGRVPDPPPAPPAYADVTATLYLWNRMDDDNALARCKWPVDWLVRNGYLSDDKRPACRQHVPEQHIDRKNQRIELTVTPVDREGA